MSGLRFLLTVAAVCAGGLHMQAQRLAAGVTPQHYALTITPDLQAATFTGTERIEITLARPMRSITLNAAELVFASVHAHLPGFPAELLPASVTINDKDEQATLTFERELPAGQVTLEIAYSGRINGKLRGFYLSRTKTRNYGVTQFESTDARRAFPCFDEPALKATFNVSLVLDPGDTAISNTPPVSDTPGPAAGKHTIAFAATPKMSTYLLAWVVGDFACSSGKSDGIPIHACSTPDKADLTRFALDAAKWDLHFYNRYFGIRYPMAKLDLIAVPDFDSGAMENFGCIIFRESELLVDQKNGTLPARKDVITTVAHEIAHQWFGDLVTPAWWDNLWLNEGFATWMENKAAAFQRPKWRFEEDAAHDLDRAMEDDSSPGTRAIHARAETPAQIDSMFDEIAYDKAGAVIGMVEHWVGEEIFRRGVQQYLAAHLYGNATAENFWDTLTRVSGLPVDRVMRSFVEQPGVPLIEIRSDAAGAPVIQTRFLSDAQAAPPEQWTIPVCFAGTGCRVLTPGAAGIDRPAGALYGNASQKGYYRTNYSRDLLVKLVAGAETTLRPAERIGLLGDRWALMISGRAPVGEVLDLAFAMKSDQNPAVLESALERLAAIASSVATGDDRDRLQGVIRHQLGPAYTAMGGYSKHEPYDRAEIREALYEALGKAGDPAVLAEAGEIAGQLLSGQKPTDPNLADAAVALAAPHGDAAMYDRVLRVVERTSDPELRETAQRVLTRFESPALVARTLDYALSPNVRSQDSPTLLAFLITHPETQEQAWTFVRHHWDDVLRKAPPGSGARVIAATGSFCSVDQRHSVAEFFAAHPVEGAERTLRRSIAQIEECVRVRQLEQPLLHAWLDAAK
jgi:aminopeptidase N